MTAEAEPVLSGGAIAGIVIGACALLCCLLCCIVPCCSNASWKKARKTEFEKSSNVAETDLGLIEYSQNGKGPWMLCLHGTPGIHDGHYNLFEQWIKDGFGVIAPSRPGYGRSPQVKTHADEADRFAALLDHLQIQSVVCWCGSGGGPSGIQFAARHPGKCKALITECAVTGNFKHPKAAEFANSSSKFMYGSTAFARVMSMMKNDQVAANALKMSGNYTNDELKTHTAEIVADPERMRFITKIKLLGACVPCYPHSFDQMNREVQLYETECPLALVGVPTLICHGDRDKDIPFSQAQQAKEKIPNSELMVIEGGSHMLMLHNKGKEMYQRQLEFARKHSNQTA